MATVVTLFWERVLRHLVLEDMIWLLLVLETVGLVDLVWWARVNSSDGSGGFIWFPTHSFIVSS